MDITGRDLIAAYGALLSTLIALVGVLRNRPRFFVVPGADDFSDMGIRVLNPSRRTLVVRDIHIWGLWGARAADIDIMVDRAHPLEQHTFLIDGEGERTIGVFFGSVEARSSWIMVFLTDYSGLLSLLRPSFVWVSSAQARRFAAASKSRA